MALASVAMKGTTEQKRALIEAHPDLAGKLAAAKTLTADSTREQASAGLDRLTPDERRQFTELNETYRTRFGFPFIICVRLHDKAGILAALRERLVRTPEEELAEALVQIGLISRLRLGDVRLSAEAPR